MCNQTATSPYPGLLVYGAVCTSKVVAESKLLLRSNHAIQLRPPLRLPHHAVLAVLARHQAARLIHNNLKKSRLKKTLLGIRIFSHLEFIVEDAPVEQLVLPELLQAGAGGQVGLAPILPAGPAAHSRRLRRLDTAHEVVVRAERHSGDIKAM